MGAAVADVVVAGAGIGGLALGCALRQRQVGVRVLERAPSLLPVGAGITVQSNAMSALQRLGLDAAVLAQGAPVTRAEIRRADGQVLSATDLEALGRELGAPTVAIHRARLHGVLLQAAGAETVRTGQAVVGYAQDADSVEVRLDDGTKVHTDLLVGADGLRSRVRAQMVADGEPLYAGYTSWRGVAAAAELLPGAETSETWGRGARFGIVPIGHGEVYWFAVAAAPPGGADTDVKAELLQRYRGWHAPIQELISATPADRIVRTDITDRPPISRWVDGRVALLGDAAHPMTPNLGQGGCQAIEDAVVLAECLSGHSDLPAALAEYQTRRVPRANGIVSASLRVGKMAQWSNPLACRLRDTAMRLTPESAVLRQMRPVLTFR